MDSIHHRFFTVKYLEMLPHPCPECGRYGFDICAGGSEDAAGFRIQRDSLYVRDRFQGQIRYERKGMEANFATAMTHQLDWVLTESGKL